MAGRGLSCSSALLGALLLVLSGCSSDPSPSPQVDGGDLATPDARGDGAEGDGAQQSDGAPQGDGVAPRPDGTTGDGPAGGCTVGQRRCAGTTHEARCKAAGGGASWVESPCTGSQVCVSDRCVAACVDTCYAGQTRTKGGVKETCKVYDEASQSYRALGSGLHDRMRDYLAWIRRHHLPNGYIAETLFKDKTFAQKQAYYGTVDSGEWSGIYLAAEALRLMATRSPEAEKSVIAQAERISELFDVASSKTPQPGYMARFWAPSGVDPLWDAIPAQHAPEHVQTTFQGKASFYLGHTSRDMYQGALLGLGLAYDALQTEAPRRRIRKTVLTLAAELVKERKAVPVKVVWGTTVVPLPLSVNLRHVILVPDEMDNGAVFVRIGTETDANDWNASELRGVREFFPSFDPVLKQLLNQIPVLGPPAAALLLPIERPGSAVTLAYFLRLAIHVASGVSPQDPDYAATQALRKSIESHYMALKPTLLPLFGKWTYHHTQACWASYFGITIVYHPTFGLSRLETDKDYRAALDGLLSNQLWPLVRNHNNLYFTYITASQLAPGAVTSAELTAAAGQLKQIRAAPKNRRLIDNSGSYPADPACQGAGVEGAPMSKQATNLADRIPVDFIWQHHPFRLRTWQPMDRFVMPGVDYLIAYWLARQGSFVQDDAPKTCLRWAP